MVQHGLFTGKSEISLVTFKKEYDHVQNKTTVHQLLAINKTKLKVSTYQKKWVVSVCY